MRIFPLTGARLFPPVAGTRRMGEPHIRRMTDAARARFLAEQGEAMKASFEAYVAKLTKKVGECDAVEYTGALWNRSQLKVRKGDVTEVWMTRVIVNVSSLGKLFNQWPTRKVR